MRTGIGYETALYLAQKGSRICLACRNQDKANAAAQKIRLACPKAKIDVYSLDLLSFASVRAFVQRWKADAAARGDEGVLDVLVCNAGAIFLKKAPTEDRLDSSYQVCHVLTSLMLSANRETRATA